MPSSVVLERVVSGGQTGVDRAALDAALEAGLPIGGWCPRGRRAEDGRLPERYPLRETPLLAYRQRTIWNVRDSDGTLILFRGRLEGGTALTAEAAFLRRKPVLAVDMDKTDSLSGARMWVCSSAIRTLNVAGPREDPENPAVYERALALFLDFFRLCTRGQSPA